MEPPSAATESDHNTLMRNDLSNEPPARITGYTVIELLIVMIIISIVAAIVYIRVAPTLERARVRGAANLLATDLQYAQVLAARFGEPMVVAVNAGTKEYSIAERDGDSTYRLRRFGTDTEYALSEFTASPTTVEMFPNALAGQTATYTLGIAGNRRQVTLTLAGQIRIANVP